MTRPEINRQLVIAATVGAGITLGVTVAGYKVGAKSKHPWIGAAVGFFLVAPLFNIPLGYAIAGEALSELDRLNTAQRTTSGNLAPQTANSTAQPPR